MSLLKEAQRVVFKVGTSTLTHKTGMMNIRRVERLVKVLSDLKNAGKEIVLVTSGAIGVGAGKLSMQERPVDIPTRQACAALGQTELMYAYDRYFSRYSHNTAQVLLTRDDVAVEKRRQNVINTFNRLLELMILPIVNENDTVSTEELELGQNGALTFGDNDTLSAIVAELTDADLLVILTDIDGLYDRDPKQNANASLIPLVETIDASVTCLAGKEGSAFGTGGMATKLQAAGLCMKASIPMYIINGSNPDNIYDLLDGKPIGTLFQATK